MRPKKPRIATLAEVEITRDREAAVVRFLDPTIATTHFWVGPSVREMTDEEILALFNDDIRARDAHARAYHHVAVEVPPGRPQLRYSSRTGQWVPRGSVLRCLIHDDGELVIGIDDHDLSAEEFSRLLITFAGWGMRICFVPDDETEKRPAIEVREPED